MTATAEPTPTAATAGAADASAASPLERAAAPRIGRFRITDRQIVVAAVAVGFAALPPTLARVAPGVFTDRWASTLTFAAVWAAMALSLNLLIGYAGQISLGQGALVAVGAYATALTTGRFYLPMGLGLVLATLTGALFAFLVGLPALRLRGLYLAITTIGFQAVVEQSLLQLPFLSRGSAGLEVPRPYAWSANFVRNPDFLALVLLIVLAIWLLDANVTRTKLGRAFRAIKESEPVAQSFGVDVVRYKLLAFTLSGALAGAAGSLYAHQILFVSSDTFSLEKISLPLLVAVVVGGLGSRVGVVVAASFFAVVPELLEALEGWDLVVGAALLIYAMVRHPGGFAQAIREAREARHTKAAKAAARAASAGDADADEEDIEIPKLPELPRPSSLPERPTLPAGTPLLEVEGVRVRFGGLVAVDDASLAVPQGKIVGLIGPNGAGKSTLFNAVSGFLNMEAGTVRFLGQDITALAPHERAQLGIGRTFQQVGLARELSVRENLLLAQHAAAGYSVGHALGFLPGAGRVEAELEARADEAIVALGFDSFADRAVRDLSGGQQRIVELACALVTAPELVLLDEPSAGMAPAAVENLAVRLRELRDDLGRTVLLIEHHIPLVLDVCDEVYVLDAGRVLAHGTPHDVATRPEVVEAYLGTAPAARDGGDRDGADEAPTIDADAPTRPARVRRNRRTPQEVGR